MAKRKRAKRGAVVDAVADVVADVVVDAVGDAVVDAVAVDDVVAVVDAAVGTVAALVINQWIDANPTAPPVDPTSSVGARNIGRYSGKKCREWQRWVMTDCRDDRRDDDEIADAATIEFAVSSHVVSHDGRFPLATVRAIRREYNAGERGRIVDGPVPQWHKNPDGSRHGILRVRDANGKWIETPYEPTA